MSFLSCRSILGKKIRFVHILQHTDTQSQVIKNIVLIQIILAGCVFTHALFNHPFTGELLKFEVEEPEEWNEYVKRGDKNPKNPFWDLGRNDFDSKQCESQRLQAGQRRLSGKDKAHMNFIESGKKFRK